MVLFADVRKRRRSAAVEKAKKADVVLEEVQDDVEARFGSPTRIVERSSSEVVAHLHGSAEGHKMLYKHAISASACHVHHRLAILHSGGEQGKK